LRGEELSPFEKYKFPKLFLSLCCAAFALLLLFMLRCACVAGILLILAEKKAPCTEAGRLHYISVYENFPEQNAVDIAQFDTCIISRDIFFICKRALSIKCLNRFPRTKRGRGKKNAKAEQKVLERQKQRSRISCPVPLCFYALGGASVRRFQLFAEQ
jgi:hypothetical protein